MTYAPPLAGAARLSLTEAWELAETPADAARDPETLAALAPEWLPATVPGTAAGALRRAGRWSAFDDRDFDASDWWFRTRFVAPAGDARLVFEGLATLAEAWLDGKQVLAPTRSAFVRHVATVGDWPGEHELLLRFASLGRDLAQKRPRPRWKTRLVARQEQRFARTPLLGRMPGWSPRPACVGPFRPVWLEVVGPVDVAEARVSCRLDGSSGVVSAELRLTAASDGVTGGTLEVGEWSAPFELAADAAGARLHATLVIADAPLWWPHTHGPQPLFASRVRLATPNGDVVVDLGRVGFRAVTVDREGGAAFRLAVNGQRIFCRGVCWSPLDVATLGGLREAYRAALEHLRDAGLNMIRVGGTMAYETTDFHALCDELGVLVWQDFMLANMDYPEGDPGWLALVRREAEELLARLATSPSLAVVCGGSEVEQQAAMLGLPKEAWSSPLFQEVLPAIVAAARPDVVYVPSTPTGGALPFRPDTGVAHYYGVGAYLRPVEDARRASVRFAAECLAFANVPEPRFVDRFLPAGASPVHHPRWKQGVPRDHGAGWDFEDVRDHYVAALFGVDPPRLRYADMERYLALGRVVTGELMAAVFAEWRRPASTCGGGLVWLHKDLVPGAGWGVIDAEGTPKAAYFFLKRALAPVALVATDEGTNGLRLHAFNDGPEPLVASLRVRLLRDGDVLVCETEAPLNVAAHGSAEVDIEALFGAFLDATYAYRFGPPAHDAIIAALVSRASGVVIARAIHYPRGLPRERERDVGLFATASARGDGAFELTVTSTRLAYAVSAEVAGFTADDAYFHLEPNEPKVVVLRPDSLPRTFGGDVSALNSHKRCRIAVTRARST